MPGELYRRSDAWIVLKTDSFWQQGDGFSFWFCTLVGEVRTRENGAEAEATYRHMYCRLAESIFFLEHHFYQLLGSRPIIAKRRSRRSRRLPSSTLLPPRVTPL